MRKGGEPAASRRADPRARGSPAVQRGGELHPEQREVRGGADEAVSARNALVAGRGMACVNLLAKARGGEDGSDGRRVLAPMHGRVVDIFVQSGDDVQKGDRLAIIEAMKMQHDILAEIDGSVDDLLIAVDQQVGADDLMITISSEDE